MGDIYQLPYDDIKTMFRNHSRSARKRGRGSQPLASTSSSSSSLRSEFENRSEDFKSRMRQTLAMQMDTLHIKRKQEEAERDLAIFCPRCTRRHPRNECPLNSIEVCSLCEEDHPTNKCPSFPRLRVAYQGAEGATEPLYFMNQRRPHGSMPSWSPLAHPSWSTPPPWSYPSQYHAQLVAH